MRRRHRFLTSPLSLFALSLAVLAGCGGRPPVGSNADGAGTQDAATSGADAGRADIDTPPIVPPTIPPSNGECAVAIRVDDCCQAPQPVALADVLADECLVLWEDRYNIPEACKKRWPSTELPPLL